MIMVMHSIAFQIKVFSYIIHTIYPAIKEMCLRFYMPIFFMVNRPE